jgi:hypothetical protein
MKDREREEERESSVMLIVFMLSVIMLSFVMFLC